MPSLRLMVRVLLIPIALAAATPAHSAVATTGEVATTDLNTIRLDNSETQAALSKGEPWRQFTARNGNWTVVWNELTRTPHRAFGRGIALTGFADDAGGADRAVRGFIADNGSLLGTARQLELVSSRKANHVWYVRYRQTLGGIPMLFSNWEFRVGENGKLTMFGAASHAPSAHRLTAPRVGAAVAREAAKAGLVFDAATDRATGGEQMFWLPRVDGGGRLDYRLVYSVRVTTAKPRANWMTLVDAENGAVLMRRNHVLTSGAKGAPVQRTSVRPPATLESPGPGEQVLAAIGGTVTGQVHYNLPNDPLTTWPFSNLIVNVGSNADTSAANGAYSVTCTGTSTVSASVRGPALRVIRTDGGPDGFFSLSTVCPGTRNIAWSSINSVGAERDVFFHSHKGHAWVNAIDPTYDESEYEMIAYVNSLDDECVAYFDGLVFTYGAVGSQCPYDIATMPDLVYKQYAQRINDDLYYASGAPFGMTNEFLHAGVGDAVAAFMTNDPFIGDGIEGAGTYLRNVDNTKRWPEDRSADANLCGLILSGAFWDLQQAAGLTTAGRLLHFARYGLPGEAPPPVLDAGAAMTEYFIELLVADDNDADLSNGTPNFNAIVGAFNPHGIGLGNLLAITHTQLDDQITNGPFPITAVIQYTGPVGALNASSPRLYYSINGTPWESRPMTPTGNPDEFGAEIPQIALGVVHYYVYAAETYGSHKTDPIGGPTNYHVFIAGPAQLMLSVDMEATTGWTVTNNFGALGSGAWTRVNPISDQRAAPEDDHTPGGGTIAWVTGQADTFDIAGTADVDDGTTTLTSTTFNATAGGLIFPIISVYRWFSNNAGEAPGIDRWKIEISNNGGSSWVPVENTLQTDQSWRRVAFLISKYVTPTNNMRIRFIATDVTGALIEAGVDDFTLYGFMTPTGVGEGSGPATLSLAPASPNPFRTATRLRYTLPTSAPVELVAYDIHGRVVRRLAHGLQGAGTHDLTWDGRDDAGRLVASGPYFLRLAQNGRRTSLGVVRIQ